MSEKDEYFQVLLILSEEFSCAILKQSYHNTFRKFLTNDLPNKMSETICYN